MLEALVSLAIAGIAGAAALNNRLHQRINSVHDRITNLDHRVDTIELGVAQDYVSKADLSVMTKRMEDHMVRIENKLDQIVLRYGTQKSN
jgi:tetrahydromethanopterin S-methyltransferase subunit G